MAVPKRYIARSKVSNARFREFLRLFASISQPPDHKATGLNRNTVNRLCRSYASIWQLYVNPLHRFKEWLRSMSPTSVQGESVANVGEALEARRLSLEF